MSSERAPSMAEVIRRHIAGAAMEMHHCKVSVVTAVDTGTSPPRVSVKPLIKIKIPDTEDGTRQLESQSIVTNVPVQFLGAGGFRITCPISDGTLIVDGQTIPATMGTLFFSDESLDAWLQGQGSEVSPTFDHRFAMDDGIFVPGLLPFGISLTSWPQDHMTIGFDEGPQIHLHSDHVTIGDEAASKAVARDDDGVSPGSTMGAWIAAVSTATGVTSPEDFGNIVATSTQSRAT